MEDLQIALQQVAHTVHEEVLDLVRRSRLFQLIDGRSIRPLSQTSARCTWRDSGSIALCTSRTTGNVSGTAARKLARLRAVGEAVAVEEAHQLLRRQRGGGARRHRLWRARLIHGSRRRDAAKTPGIQRLLLPATARDQ